MQNTLNAIILTALLTALAAGIALALPPNPGEGGKETIQGIDTNNNGIRDDVERYLLLTYPDNPTLRAALTTSATTLQHGLELAANHGPTQATADAFGKYLSTQLCIELHTHTGTPPEPGVALRSAVINTPERVNAYQLFEDAFTAGFHAAPNIPEPCPEL